MPRHLVNLFSMKILAFETSCDDTAVAIIEDGTKVLSSVCVSQMEHGAYGGVVPEVAARLHSENWREALDQCLEEAKLRIENIDYFAMANGPGLQTSLLTGTTAASFLSLLYGKKLIPVHHIFGHACSNFLEREISDFVFPSLVLVASGGHTELHLWEDFIRMKRIGRTLDDAAGEAFDKVSKMLGLGYPGGPLVSKEAEKGNPGRFKFPRILLGKESLDFSFSGLKGAVFREVRGVRGYAPLLRGEGGLKPKAMSTDIVSSTEGSISADICASFQAAVVDIFCKKVERAREKYPQVKAVHFVGGVSANSAIQESLGLLCEKFSLDFFVPVKNAFSTDNAAMVASSAYFLVRDRPDIAKVQFLDAEPKKEH